MSDYNKIQLKRTLSAYGSEALADQTLDFGEPLFINGNYLLVGANGGSSVNTAKVFKAVNKALADTVTYHTTSNGRTILKNEAGAELYLDASHITDSDNKTAKQYTDEKVANALYAASTTHAGAATNVNSTAVISGNYYVACVGGNGSQGIKYNTGVTVNAQTGVLLGAAWNDFAENRRCNAQAGTVVCETGKGDLLPSGERLQAGAAVVSDTYGMLIGEKGANYKPVAVAGRVLVYYIGEKEKYHAGDAVCAGPFGRVDLMTREEIKEYPDRILGYVSEIPTYETWNKVKVNNRIWIKIA